MVVPEILLIEDRKEDRDLFAAAARVSGLAAKITFAHDANDAVVRLLRLREFAGTQLPCLVVLDLGLPGLQGHTLLQVIRSTAGAGSVPVVVLTGDHRVGAEAEVELSGISEFMIKPQDFTKLVAWVGSLARFLPQRTGPGDARVAASQPSQN